MHSHMWVPWDKAKESSGGFRNWERGVQPLAHKAHPLIFGLPRPLPVTLEVQTEYLEATLGLVKCLEISKELIRECVTMPGCCCMPLLHNHLMDSCSYNYVRKITPPPPPWICHCKEQVASIECIYQGNTIISGKRCYLVDMTILYGR